VPIFGDYCKQIREQTMRYIRGYWGLPFIAGFLLLLVAASILLAVGWASTAESTATLAYFVLAVGVLLQLVCHGKNKLKNGAVFHGSD
jgi:hypothetical protein